MIRFIVRRLIAMVGVVLVLSLLLFFWLRALPGGPVSAILGERATRVATCGPRGRTRPGPAGLRAVPQVPAARGPG